MCWGQAGGVWDGTDTVQVWRYPGILTWEWDRTTEHLLIPNPAKEENMSKQTSVRSEVDGWLHGEATSYQYMDCGKYRMSSFPIQSRVSLGSHPQQSIPDIFPSPGSWMAAEHQPAVRALLAAPQPALLTCNLN